MKYQLINLTTFLFSFFTNQHKKRKIKSYQKIEIMKKIFEYGFQTKKDKNQFNYSLTQIDKSNIELIEIELEYIGTKKLISNFSFKNDDSNYIKFAEILFSKDECYSKLQLIILFPENIEVGEYYVIGHLNVDNKQYPGFGITIEINNSKKEKESKEVKSFILGIIPWNHNKSINFNIIQNLFKKINLYNLLFPIKDELNSANNNDIEQNETFVSSLIEINKDLQEKIIQLTNEKESLQSSTIISELKSENTQFIIKSNKLKDNSYTIVNTQFKIRPNKLKINSYIIVNYDGFSIYSNNQSVNLSKNNEDSIQKVNDLDKEPNYLKFEQHKKLLNEYRKLMESTKNKKTNIEKYKIQIQEQFEFPTNKIKNEFQMTNISNFESLNEQNKTEKLTEEKINNIIGYLDSKFYVNSIFNRDDIIKAIKKGEGDIEKVREFLFV